MVDGYDWLSVWTKAAGRPLRVLHIGNIANNGYNNARIQRRCGIIADVLCYDYYHIMGTPEWEDADFEGDYGNDILPDWSRVKFKSYERPRWFAAGPLALACRYLSAHVDGDTKSAERLWRAMIRERHVLASQTPRARAGMLLRKVPLKLSYEWRKLRERFGLSVNREHVATASGARDWTNVERLFAGLFPDRSQQLKIRDLAPYYQRFSEIAKLMDRYDVIQGYAIDGIWPLLAGKPYVAYEHGTLRDLPFEASGWGALVALVFGAANRVFVTNVDCLAAADRLNLDTGRVTALPHAFDEQRLIAFRKSRPNLRPSSTELRFFAPARHDWTRSDPSLSKGNDRMLRAVVDLVRDGIRMNLVLVRWGRDVQASQSLIEELDLGHIVRWIEPLRKQELWSQYLKSHAVLDQFLLPAFGGITFEALALGRRVITSLDMKAARRFFGEAPPILVASGVEEIAAAMRVVAADSEDHKGRGALAADWVRRYHSAERIVGLQLNAYQALLEENDVNMSHEDHLRRVRCAPKV